MRSEPGALLTSGSVEVLTVDHVPVVVTLNTVSYWSHVDTPLIKRFPPDKIGRSPADTKALY
jgi:hypothetical protein